MMFMGILVAMAVTLVILRRECSLLFLGQSLDMVYLGGVASPLDTNFIGVTSCFLDSE